MYIGSVPDDNGISAGRRLEAWREFRKLKKTQLARKLGVSHVTVGRWERGEGFSTDALARVCRVFGITEEVFYGDLPGV